MEIFFHDIVHEFSLPFKDPVLILFFIFLIILVSNLFVRKLPIPNIIVLIISGIIIGPNGFNLIERNLALNLYSIMGLLFIMFIAGLELDLNEFILNKYNSILFGIITFIIPFSVSFPVFYYVFDYSFLASLLISSMFSTHTLVSYPIVSRLGLAKHKIVPIALGGTILTDTLALLVFSFIIKIHQEKFNLSYLITFSVAIILYVFLMINVIPKFIRKILSVIESEKYTEFIFILFVVFLSALLSIISGLEPIIGAFIAGLILNRFVPNASILMNRIEFIGNAIFIPFFMISVGMVVDLKLFFQDYETLTIIVTLIVVAIFTKWLAALIYQKIKKMSSINRQLLFGLTSSHAAATVVIILIGYEIGIIDKSILNATILLILISCILSAFVTEKSAKKIVIEEKMNLEKAEILSQPLKSQSFQEKILVTIANIENIEKLLEFSIYIKDPESKNSISILSIVLDHKYSEKRILNLKHELEKHVSNVEVKDSKIDTIITVDYNVPKGITRVCKEIMANILILGWPKDRGYLEKILGEKLQNILESTNKTIFICYFQKPLPIHKNIVLLIPPFSEHEEGFIIWFNKIINLSKQLNLPIKIYCNLETKNYIEKLLNNIKYLQSIHFEIYNDWEDYQTIVSKDNGDDLFVFVSSRKGRISYLPYFDNQISKLEHLKSRILVYPEQYQ